MSDSDYEYQYEDEDHDVNSQIYDSDSEDEYMESHHVNIPPLAMLPTSYVICSHTPQYQWVVLCQRLKFTYGDECTFDINTYHKIMFTVNGSELTLSVDPSISQKLWYPNVAPVVQLSGIPLQIDSHVLITNNRIMSKNGWNICADINAFVFKSMKLMKTSAYDVNMDISINNAFIEIVQHIGMVFEFDNDNELPSFGSLSIIKSVTRLSCGYLSTNDNICKFGSLSELLSDPIDIIANATDKIMPYTNNLLTNCIDYLITGISKLEILQSERYYRNIVKIVKSLGYNIDVSMIEDALSNTPSDIISDKLLFVDSFAHHSFNSTFRPNGKFVKRLYAEIETLVDTLSDIDCYIAVSESNIQQFKILMIPDYDTPYGGGYFEFDMFIPDQYPNIPPNVKFLTTGGGSVRFNPNLYNNGKVCLSILNTWATNQWNAVSSTLSQVILSIFTMIFVEHPYTNEPAFYNALQTESGKKKSESYTENIIKECVRVAIRGQLTNTNTPFADIIRKHWATNKQKTIDAYAKHGIVIDV